MRKLLDKILYYQKMYDEGNPVIADDVFDDYIAALKDMEEQRGYYYPDSPLHSIPSNPIEDIEKVSHKVQPMLSLAKTKDKKELLTWMISFNSSCDCMLKLDGVSCRLTYEEGKLVRGETRGDGIVGDDITHIIRTVTNVPQIINHKGSLIVDGEIICKENDFKDFAEEYKNPRNYVAGVLHRKEDYAHSKLSFIVWDCISGIEGDSLTRILQSVDHLGFEIVPLIECGRIEMSTLELSFNKLLTLRQTEGYPIDGIVVKVDDRAKYFAKGKTAHHFKGGLAFKFYDNGNKSHLKNIEWSIGRTGQLTPVAIFDKIHIEGTDVERASLHNISIMQSVLNHPFVGQEITVIKANQIIPQIIAAAEPQGECEVYLDIPEVCPFCGEPTSRKKDTDSEYLYCDNPNCDAKLVNRLDHFAGKKGLDIKGLSKSTLEKLIDYGWVNDIRDLFTLKAYRQDWIAKPGFGLKSVDKILTAIDEASHCTLSEFIASLGIPLIGKSIGKTLANHFGSWEDFRAVVDEGDFLDFDGFGEEMNSSLKNFDYSEADYLINEEVIDLIEQPEEVIISNKIGGKSIVVTGKLHDFTRNEFKAKLESVGAKMTGSISGKTFCLVTNDKYSETAKNKKAKELGIPIYTEEQFMKEFFTT